ncbi:hypothetical protein N7535_005314 [Penicillium sp. DV-2018c]|nr:hypothetical protein N7461_008895 [Penicillium sp. DV-2018c]KAJ5571654.1 hypothetical protein N7535_005314 [Penicillium sp. DV-2018c]
MTPSPSLPPDTQRDIVRSILRTLDVANRASYSNREIMDLGATVGTFDPDDQDFLGSETQCLFKPISKEDIEPWKISAAEAAVVGHHIEIPDLDLVSRSRAPLNITVATEQVYHFIKTQFNYRRQGKTYLRDTFGWNMIDPEELYGDNEGFLYSVSGKCIGVDTPGWRSYSLEEWWDGETLAGPSVRFILCTDGIAEDKSLLLSELGAVAQVIAFRRTQPKFLTSMLFPAS